MAEVLNRELDEAAKADTKLWPVDKAILVYFACTSALVATWWQEVPDAYYWICWHALLTAVLLFQIRRPNPTSWFFRNWYPVIYVASCYKAVIFCNENRDGTPR